MKKYDLIVAGGGLAGVAAAVAAARDGMSVLLVEKSGSLGGALSGGLVYPFCPYYTEENGEITKIVNAGLFSEMIKRHNEKIVGHFPPAEPNICQADGDIRRFKTEYFKMALDDMISEYGVDVLYHSMIYDVTYEGREIKSIKASTKIGSLELEADFFVDATGDGEVFYLAGCDHLLGREGDNLSQPMTTCFRVCNVDIPLYKKEMPELQRLYKEKRASGEITNPRENILQFYGLGEGIVHYNTTRIVMLDPTDPLDLSRAEAEARRQVYEVVDFLKKNSKAYKDAVLVSVASEIGVRESRKLRGMHVITEEELFACTRFEDSIALGNYDVDIHSPDGTGTRIRKFDRDKYYTIPYRSLLPKEYDNLLVAGRCISTTHEAQSSVRIMPICVSMGEAAGVAVAEAKHSGKNAHTVDIKKVQELLINFGAQIY